MSTQNNRNIIVYGNVPKLIKSLYDDTLSDENLVLCEQFAISKLQHHKYLSANSHEIQRNIDGLCERLSISNYPQFGDRLKTLCNLLISNPLCKAHYESDIHWNILCFLFEMAHRPVDAAINNRFSINLTDDFMEIKPAIKESCSDDLVALMKSDNILQRNIDGSDAELSDWSDPEENVENNTKDHVTLDVSDKCIPMLTCTISPPRPSIHLQSFDTSNSEMWLCENIQHSWWCGNEHNLTEKPNDHISLWNSFLKKNSIASPLINRTIVSEYCLINEIIWMFIEPTTTKYFSIDDNTAIVTVTEFVENCTNLNGIISVLHDFARHISIFVRLHRFCISVNQPIDKLPPSSYECYANGIQQCLRPFVSFLMNKKQEHAPNQINTKSHTLISLQAEIEPYFKLLQHLYQIHLSSILDFNTMPSHICSSYLFSGLLCEINASANEVYANLVSTLLLSTFRVYLQIVDAWWTDAHFEDIRNEFLIEKSCQYSADINDPLEGFQIRNFTDNVPSAISSVVLNSSLTKLLCNHSMQTGHALNILYAFDRLKEMKASGYQENLYDSFIQTVLKLVLRFSFKEKFAVNDNITSLYDQSKKYSNAEVNTKLNKFCKDSNFDDNDILSLAIEGAIKSWLVSSNANPLDIIQSKANTLHLFERFQNISLMLPIEEIILSSLSQLLDSRTKVANMCVIKLYKKEYQVLNHLKNLRKVYLFGASDLMHTFFINLFKRIESSDAWSNSYLLTVLLNDIISSKYPEMSSLFAVQVPSRKYEDKNVLNVIKYIFVNYIVDDNLKDIISEECLKQYNQVFQFLLKIKWGLWILENLRFPESQKKRQPYMEFNMQDLLFKRLMMVRNWLLYSMQCIHSHLMTQVLQSMGHKFDEKIENARSLSEILTMHKSYIHTIYDYCFQTKIDHNIRVGIEQLLTLISVVRNGWYIMKDEDEIDGGLVSQIDDIENAFINCHSYLTGIISVEVYSKNRPHLSALSSAFSCSCPY